jgi:hypothetical protein
LKNSIMDLLKSVWQWEAEFLFTIVLGANPFFEALIGLSAVQKFSYQISLAQVPTAHSIHSANSCR